MTEQQENSRFQHIFWFCVGVMIFCALLSTWVIQEFKSEAHTATILTFWLTTCGAGVIGFLIGSSVNKSRASTVEQKGDNPVVNIQPDSEEVKKD